LDKELQRWGHRFVRYADDCNIYLRSKRSGERVLESVERFLRDRLRLTVNRQKSAVDRPWNRKFLGYTFTTHFQPKLKLAPQSVQRLKARMRTLLRRGRGQNLGHVVEELRPVLLGWTGYFRKSEVRSAFEELDSGFAENCVPSSGGSGSDPRSGTANSCVGVWLVTGPGPPQPTDMVPGGMQAQAT
jgi:RNA-directed DNA polymerase